MHGAPIAEAALRAGAAKPLVLGFARVDEQLKVDRAQIRPLATAAAKARRAFDKAAKQAAQQGLHIRWPKFKQVLHSRKFLRKDFPFLSMAMTETQLHLTTPTQELLEMPVVTGSAAAMGCDQ